VGTWHKNDYAVELASDDARVWQDNGTVTSADARCFEFAMVAKIDSGTRVFLELDFMADGSNELSQRLPTSDWERLTFRITTPDWYHGVRFSLRKDGPGRAVLAELSAVNAPGQCTAPALELLDRPDGARCSRDEECRAGHCDSSVCGACANDADCAQDELCGLILGDGRELRACLARSASPFGVACAVDAQCQSGHCQQQACSECSGNLCDDGRSCSPARRTDTDTRYWPRLCDPGSHARGRGELCTSHSDCASGFCKLENSCASAPCETVLSVGVCS
jgi:hypothetical protein